MVDDNIVDTDNSACFAPNIAANRGDTALYMWRMREQPGAPSHPFNDVIDEDQHKAVSWMYANGITDGKSPTAFAPDDTLTRGEVAAFLHRLAGRPHATDHPFTDVTAPWQQQPVAWMFLHGITTGTGPTTFAPDEPVARGQLATFLYRYKGEPPVTIDPASPDCNEFTAVAAGDEHSCGLRTDQTIACWGSNNYGESNPPVGQFTTVSTGGNHACGLRIDNTITCWGDNLTGETDPPSGQFTALASGSAGSCGIRTDNTLACWGQDFRQPTDTPDGRFTDVTIDFWHSCALRTDKTITCWGPDDIEGRTDAPTGQFTAITGGISCGLRTDMAIACWGPDDDLDKPGGRFTAITGGQSHSCGLGIDKTVSCWGYNESESISEAAVRLADPEIDFSGIDVVMTVGPSTHFDGANAGGQVTTNEGILTTNRINVPSRSIIFLGDGTLQEWGHAAAHEFAHNLGLADLYDASGSRASRTAAVAGWPSAEFGLMGFRVLLPPKYGYRFDGGEMLAWNRWLLGWLDPSQIRCVTEPEAIVDLSPAADPGNGTAMAAIPLSATELIVVESRRRLGYDSDILHRLPEGVLVYTVDAAIATGALPIKGANETTSGYSDESPFLTEGQSITVAGYTITLLSDDGETHTVKISRTNTYAGPVQNY